MIDELIAVLGKDLDLTPEEIADIFWLTLQRQEINQTITTPAPQPKIIPPVTEETDVTSDYINTSPKLPEIPKAQIYSSSSNSTTTNSISLRIPDAPSLRTPLALAQSLRPLMRRVASDKNTILDETATVDYFANQSIFVPIFKSEPEPWLDLALVVDESKSMLIWRHTIRELKRLLEHYGVFRDVRTWGLVIDNKEILLRPEINGTTQRLASPRELIDTTGRRLILVVSDCVTGYWRDSTLTSIFKLWTITQPVAIVQMLPQWLWSRTGLNAGASVRLGSLAPGVANQHLLIKELLLWKDIDIETGIKIPVLTLEPEVASSWSQTVAGKSDATAAGIVFAQEPKKPKPATNRQPPTINPEERVHRFRMTASPIARKLASLLAAAPVINLPVVRLIQETMLPTSQQVNVAEVFLGGLLKPINEIQPDTNPDAVQYSFMDDAIRDIFLTEAPVCDSADVVDAVSKYICGQLGKSLSEFVALLKAPNQDNEPEVKAFAEVTARILKRLGGDYARFAEENLTPRPPSLLGKGEAELQTFSFEVVTVNRRGAIIKRETSTAQYFTENLGNNVTLDMVAIPGGTFLMGAPEDEEGSSDDERPQHEVTVKPFFMGKYPVTQAQWRAVAALPQINRELKPEPSHFKGNDLPVECVSWYDTIEFCDRLTKYSGRNYRLPSEAEWEYACRAGTITPFHFGETITTELVNFYGTERCADAPKGEYREKTTVVGSFPPNAFGLHDMHGSVWEWCADNWHENYLEVPHDDNSWRDAEIIESGTNENDNLFKLLRGSAWNYSPHNCRSAFRSRDTPDNDVSHFIGFRVVCGGAAWIL
jgi:formylglycine-generating enzyme required for sulfatase activity